MHSWGSGQGSGTYGWIDESQEYDGADHCPHRLDGALLEPLGHHLVETMTHTSQFGWKPEITTPHHQAVLVLGAWQEGAS